jgi:3-isopropylmalate/(R)-2-methylmalate dehydratase small subunit
MSAPIRGRVVRLGDDVNTDMILPGQYLNLMEPEELGPHLLETYYDPEVPKRVAAGDILVAGRNCGTGSSREQAQLALLGRGVAAIVAVSFARIFQRNCLNLGLLAIENAEAAAAVQDGDTLTIDLATGRLSWDGGEAVLPVQPAFVTDMLDRGGIVGWVRGRLAERGA